MKKILVPLDFTAASKNALRYARQLALQLGADISVVHVWQKPDNKGIILPDDMAVALSIKGKQALIDRLANFCTGYPHEEIGNLLKSPLPEFIIKEGSIIQGILMAAEEKKADLIVIGTKAKHSLREYLFGSISTQLIEKAEQAVFIVPEGASYVPVQKIAFATKIDIGLYPVVSNLKDLAKALKAKVFQVFVSQLPMDFSDEHEQTMTTGWLEEAGAEFAQVTVIRDRSITRGLDFFIKKHQMDMLAMHLPFRAPIEKLFHRSQTKQMIFHSQIPMLIIRE